jgi:hypothetical protein
MYVRGVWLKVPLCRDYQIEQLRGESLLFQHFVTITLSIVPACVCVGASWVLGWRITYVCSWNWNSHVWNLKTAAHRSNGLSFNIKDWGPEINAVHNFHRNAGITHFHAEMSSGRTKLILFNFFSDYMFRLSWERIRQSYPAKHKTLRKPCDM